MTEEDKKDRSRVYAIYTRKDIYIRRLVYFIFVAPPRTRECRFNRHFFYLAQTDTLEHFGGEQKISAQVPPDLGHSSDEL